MGIMQSHGVSQCCVHSIHLYIPGSKPHQVTPSNLELKGNISTFINIDFEDGSLIAKKILSQLYFIPNKQGLLTCQVRVVCVFVCE